MIISCHGFIQEKIKKSSINLKLNDTKELKSILSKKFDINQGYAISINGRIAGNEQKIAETDEVLLIAPFEGG